MKNLRISTKLYMVLAVSIVTTIIVTVFGLINVNSLSTHLTAVDDLNVRPLNSLVRIVDHFDTLRMYVRNAALTPDPEKTQRHVDRIVYLYGELVASSNEYLEILESNGITEGEEYETLTSFIAALPGALEIVNGILDAAIINDQEEAYRLIETECVPYNQQLSDYLNELADVNARQSDEVSTAAARSAANALVITVIISIAAIALLLFLILMVSNSIIVPMRQMVEASNSLANGNLNMNLDTQSLSETGDLARGIRRAADTFSDLIGEMKKVAVAHNEHGEIDV